MSTQDPLIGQKLGDYTILSVLGRGGMARVYKGIDKHLERYAAVKVIEAQLLTGKFAEEYQARFRREARAIARLNHPHIVNVYQYGNQDNAYYMAMRFIEGHDLGYILRAYRSKGERVPLAHVINIGRDIASALDYAHQEGVIHRDVKPSNIMVARGGQAILTDFGLALNIPEGSLGRTFGSAHYIAPEQATASNNAVPQSDLYALAVVLFEMVTGKVPFDDESDLAVALQHIRFQPPAPSTINPQLTAQVDAVFAKALDKWISNRYETGQMLIDELEAALRVGDLLQGSLDNLATLQVSEPKPTQQPKPNVVETILLEPTPAVAPSQAAETPLLDSTPSHATSLTAKSPLRPDFRLLLIGLSLVVLLLAIVVLMDSGSRGALALVASATRQPSLTVTPPPTQAARVASPTLAPPTRTLVPSPIPTLTPSATASPTATPTREPSRTPSPTRTLTPSSTPTITPRPTASPTRTSVPTPTLTATIPFMGIMPTSVGTLAVDDTEDVALTYTDPLFTLTNLTDDTLDLSGIAFTQTLADGSLRQFRADRWTFASFSIGQLPARGCVQVWSDTFSNIDLRGTCRRSSGFAVPTDTWFWQRTTAGALFVVRRGGTVLATCPIAAGECRFSIE
jgi:serine/threonine protein kinase